MEYKRPALTTDVVLFKLEEAQLQVLLIQRGHAPFAGSWAFPGGFVDYDESPDVGAHRELQEETGLTGAQLEQAQTFGNPGRDPRGHTVSIVYWGFIEANRSAVQGSDDAAEARWFNAQELPPLAFDHAEVFAVAREKLKDKLKDGIALLNFLPETLTIKQLRQIHDTLNYKETAT